MSAGRLEETLYIPENRKNFGPDCYPQDPLHFAAAEGNLEQVQDAIRTGANIYRTALSARDGATPLHVAIFNRQREVVEALMEAYRKDFDAVQEYLVEKGLWQSGEEQWWLKKPIAVASSAIACNRAKELEESCGEGDKVVLVLLKNSSEEEKVAVIRVTDVNKEQVKSFKESLRPNGFLSWNSSHSGCETFLQLAAFCGDLDLITKLAANGADLSEAGKDKMTPLMEACSVPNLTVIKLLFEEFGDRFDSTVVDRFGLSALGHVLQRADAEAFDYVLKKMIAYRVDKFQETENEAFNKVFHFEHGPLWSRCSIWSVIPDSFKHSLEPFLKQYRYDLSFQHNDRIMLMEVIIRHTAKDFYQSEIRSNRELLSLTDRDGCNVLHVLLMCNELDFVKELYQTHPEFCKSVFECDGAVISLECVLMRGHKEVLRFLLEEHLDFLRTVADKAIDLLFEEDILPDDIFGEPLSTMLDHLPELRSQVEELQNKVVAEQVEWMDNEEYNRGLTYRMLGW